jgi:hypothetical protein
VHQCSAIRSNKEKKCFVFFSSTLAVSITEFLLCSFFVVAVRASRCSWMSQTWREVRIYGGFLLHSAICGGEGCADYSNCSFSTGKKTHLSSTSEYQKGQIIILKKFHSWSVCECAESGLIKV